MEFLLYEVKDFTIKKLRLYLTIGSDCLSDFFFLITETPDYEKICDIDGVGKGFMSLTIQKQKRKK